MVGLGEELKEVIQVMDDLRTARVDFLLLDNIYNLQKSIFLYLNM